MPRKRPSVSDVLQEKAQNLPSPEGETVIDVAAQEIKDESPSTTEAPSTQPEDKVTSTSKHSNLDTADVEATVKQLQVNLEKAQEQARHKEEALQQQISELQSALSEKTALEKAQKQALQKEEALQQQISELQSALSEKTALTERFSKELYEAKQAAVQLAEANSRLTEEINTLKQEKENQSKKKKEKESIAPITYRKSYRHLEKLPLTQPQESADNSSQMWLLD
ncbi:hypothetical protein [Chlorogloeopsis sp. ULAP02]|uniref:hypothetical protein n=1 Tax=Chlorogloeopsis sp. ULAP02 TaxID=3107926 RepID=UPI0031357A4D